MAVLGLYQSLTQEAFHTTTCRADVRLSLQNPWAINVRCAGSVAHHALLEAFGRVLTGPHPGSIVRDECEQYEANV
jgi:hypothetical protein